MRGDRELWRDIGHAVLYTTIGGNVAQLVFLYGFAFVLANFGRASGLALWPVHSPVGVQVLMVVLVGDMLEYWYHRLAHTVPWLGRCTRCTTRPSACTRSRALGITCATS